MKPLPSILRVTDPIYRKGKFLSTRHNYHSCLPPPRRETELLVLFRALDLGLGVRSRATSEEGLALWCVPLLPVGPLGTAEPGDLGTPPSSVTESVCDLGKDSAHL